MAARVTTSPRIIIAKSFQLVELLYFLLNAICRYKRREKQHEKYETARAKNWDALLMIKARKSKANTGNGAKGHGK